MLSSYRKQTPTLPNYSTANPIQHDNYSNQHDNLTTQHDNSVKNGTDTPIKVYSKTNYHFPPPSFHELI